MTTDARWWQRLTAPVRRLRWAAAGWSSQRDRAFHDELFADQLYDPFSPSYPGYLTIRRFADHAERHLADARAVVDFGCGPGEITCELARRRPGVQFTGLDHSDVAIERARASASRLELSNVTFEIGDVERFEPESPVDLVVMFDAFHHVLDPAAFLARLKAAGCRVFLIEPAGTWLGQWDHRLDLDWVPSTVREMRRRLEHQFGLGVDPSAEDRAPSADPAPSAKRPEPMPTERRYTLTDLERLFAGFVLDVRGTMAGLETYGPDVEARSVLGDRFGNLTHELVAGLEDALFAEGLDLALKHWAILATPIGAGAAPASRRLRLPEGRPTTASVMPAYGVRYEHYAGPSAVRPNEAFRATVRLANTGWLPWDSRDERPVMVSYHWLDSSARTIVEDGLRTPLDRVVGSGETVEAVLRVEAPGTPGHFTLAIDLVHEGVVWFSDEGVPPRREAIRVSGDA